MFTFQKGVKSEKLDDLSAVKVEQVKIVVLATCGFVTSWQNVHCSDVQSLEPANISLLQSLINSRSEILLRIIQQQQLVILLLFFLFVLTCWFD